MITNWDSFKCRCSGIHKIMANSRSNPQLTEKQAERLKHLQSQTTLTVKMGEEMAELLVKKGNGSKIILSDTAVEYLMEVYSWEVYGKLSFGKETYEVDQMEKGKLAEAESIMLLSMLDDVYYTKNEERIENEFLSGHPDIFIGENIMSATKITDIKTCFDYPSFLKKKNVALPIAYTNQVQGYCDITGAGEGEIAHVVADMPESMINEFKKRLFYKMEVATEENPEFKAKWEILENSMRFHDIAVDERIFKQKVEPFTEREQQQVYDRVKVCREWLWKFHEQHKKITNGVLSNHS